MNKKREGTSKKPAPTHTNTNDTKLTMICLSYMIIFILIFIVARHYESRDLMMVCFGNIMASGIYLLINISEKETK